MEPGTNLVTYAAARELIPNCSLYLYRPRGWRSFWSRLIADSTGGPYSHAGLIRVRNGGPRREIDVLEMLEGKGGRAVPLWSIVERFPGCIDVYTLNRERFPEFDPEAATHYMHCLTGREYGRRALAQLALRRSPILWHYFAGDDAARPAEHSWPPFCSFAVELACRLGGGGAGILNERASLVTPNDLRVSHLWQYAWTLT
jgi:hypothetical protein